MFNRLILASAAVLLITFASGCAEGPADSPRALKGRISELVEENTGLKERVEALRAQIEDFDSELATVRAERNALKKELSVLKSRGSSGARRR